MKPRRENPDLGLAGVSGSFRELTRHLPFVPFNVEVVLIWKSASGYQKQGVAG
jgi:hypothetical protein